MIWITAVIIYIVGVYYSKGLNPWSIKKKSFLQNISYFGTGTSSKLTSRKLSLLSLRFFVRYSLFWPRTSLTEKKYAHFTVALVLKKLYAFMLNNLYWLKIFLAPMITIYTTAGGCFVPEGITSPVVST